jgi:hypothetical protein
MIVAPIQFENGFHAHGAGSLFIALPDSFLSGRGRQMPIRVSGMLSDEVSKF